ncbi:methionine gamma-lyase [Kangiella sediminilitoris]|uniref:L-methionine gamma-lyase n=1 Tax=Kangiella sediminilitoris TaxID=1144748 RepID=A0A1B3BAX4_9GAMM|nr:methionine gamma-lyase [Kangiella sediminilitoris]AOE49945.1 methionine gamma-lyase [Kangiella sediminilitoris]
MSSSKSHFNNIETRAIHAGRVGDPSFGSLATPIHQTSTFIFDNVQQGANRFAGEEQGYIYSRLGNPTVRELEQKMAALENTEDAAAFGSGMGAVSATLLANLKQGDHLVASSALYGCSFALINHKFADFGIEVTFVDITDLSEVEDAVKENTKLIYFETPINPNMVCADMEGINQIAKKHDLLTVMDNTFMSPVLQQPSDFGMDLIIHSATKYLNGHGDVIGGIVCGSAEQIEHIKMTTQKDMGATMSPNDAWLICRGLKTLSVRVERHCDNAEKLADYLSAHPDIEAVYYPGLKSHPANHLIGKQMKRAGGVIAFEVSGGFDDAVRFMNQLELCHIAVSLGDAETLIQHPASMTHSTYTPEERAEAGISETLIRISVGLEHADDIIGDLEQALQKMKIKVA